MNLEGVAVCNLGIPFFVLGCNRQAPIKRLIPKTRKIQHLPAVGFLVIFWLNRWQVTPFEEVNDEPCGRKKRRLILTLFIFIITGPT